VRSELRQFGSAAAQTLFASVSAARSGPCYASLAMTKLALDQKSNPTALWDETGNFIGTALARMERGKAFSIMLGRIQQELCDAYGAENARKMLQAILDTMKTTDFTDLHRPFRRR
jgi:hypothetical protein